MSGADSVAGPTGGRGRSRSLCLRPLPRSPPPWLSPGRAGAGVPGRRQRLGGARRATRMARGAAAAAAALLGSGGAALYIEAPGACPVPGGGGAGEGAGLAPSTQQVLSGPPTPPVQTPATSPQIRCGVREGASPGKRQGVRGLGGTEGQRRSSETQTKNRGPGTSGQGSSGSHTQAVGKQRTGIRAERDGKRRGRGREGRAGRDWY